MVSNGNSHDGSEMTGGQSDARAASDAFKANFAQVDPIVERFSLAARAEACVGPATTTDGHTTIPLASVSLQAGFGMGFGSGREDSGDKGSGGGGGGGGGGKANSRVIAVVDISDAGINVRPVPDVTSIALGFLALVGVSVLSSRGKASGGMLRLIRRQG